MGRRKSQVKESKRKVVKVHPITRDADGGPEPYAILDSLVGSARPDLAEIRIALAYRSGWTVDKDGRLIAGKCCKPNEVSRQLMDYDVVILLNEELWPHLEAIHREELIFHELEHIAVELDAQGEEKLDEKGRIVLRIRHHDIEEFASVEKKYGGKLRREAAALWAAAQEPLLASCPAEGETKPARKGRKSEAA